MSSINMLVSEIAHAVNQADSVPVRRAIQLGIIHARNEIIRKSFNNHHFTDKVLQQRVRLNLIDVPDGDLAGTYGLVNNVKRTMNKVPRPTRLSRNLPFHSVRTAGCKNPIEIAWAKEASMKYYKHLPGFCPNVSYDYINEYIYISAPSDIAISNIGSIIVESVFEYPHLINIEQFNDDELLVCEDAKVFNYDDEFLLPEDMIGAVKKLVLETFIPEIVKDTNEINKDQIVQ